MYEKHQRIKSFKVAILLGTDDLSKFKVKNVIVVDLILSSLDCTSCAVFTFNLS